MDWTGVLGWVAGICTTIAVLPQIGKAWATKKVKDVSPLMFGVLVTGVFLWTIYGVVKQDWPIIITNGIALLLNGLMLYLMLHYKNR